MSKTFIGSMWPQLLTLLIVFMVLAPVFAQEVHVRDHDADWLAPPEAAMRANPLAGRTDAVAGGRKLFHQRCSQCHRDDGRGTAKAPDLTQLGVQAQTDGALYWKISGGNSRQGMPAFSFLPAPQRWQLVLELRAMAPRSSELR
jgi:mono/diheme cytochrome c family protein